MADFNLLLPNVQVETKSCSIGLINRTIRWTIQEFCQKTHYWQHRISPITLLKFTDNAPGTYIYSLPIPEGSRMVVVREFVMDGQTMVERSVDWLDEYLPDWRSAVGNSQYYLMLSDRQVRFIPASDAVKPLAVVGRLVLEPNHTSTTFGDELLRYEEGLVNGVLSRLLTMKSKPWTDGPRASVCSGIYQMAISDAKQEALRDWNYGGITTEKAAWV